MFRRFAEIVLIFKWPIFLALILTTVIMGGAVFRLHIDPSMEALFIKSSPEYQYYREYREKYGSDQVIAVAVETEDVFTLANLERLKGTTEEIASYPQVERVTSLANVMDIKHRFFGVKIVPALRDVYRGDVAPHDIRDEILANELYSGNLVSEDGTVANILIYLRPSGSGSGSSGEFIERLRGTLESLETPDFKFYMAGAPVEQFDFIRLIRRDQFTFVPLITGLLVITTFLIYRSVACMLLSMSIVFMTLIWTVGTISIMGQELNLMTSLLAPVIMIISVVNSIHLMNLFFEIRPHHASLRRAVVLTIEQLGTPCFLTHATTMLGFLSLSFSPIPAIKSFGTFAALGTFYSYLVEMFLTPILFPILPYRRTKDTFDERHFFNRVVIGFLEKLEFRWKWWILALTVAGMGISIYGATKIRVDTNIVKQMKEDLPLAVATRFIDERLTGVYNMGFVLRRKDGGTFDDPSSLTDVDRFKDFLEARPEITKVNSITTLIKKINFAREDEGSAYRIPEDKDRVERYFEGIRESEDSEVWKLISRDFREIRLEARIKAVGTSQGAVVEDAVKDYIVENLEARYEYHQTGNIVLLGRMAKDLVVQQVKSFSIAFLSILILIAVIFRSFWMGVLSAIPNLFPIMAVYGLMGFAGIELSSTTAMISSIVLGMVVDSSIHFLHRFQHEFSKRYHYLQALHHTYRNVGQALFISTLVLVVGFASSIFANFKPTIYFGALTSFTIAFALVCTLIILPVCLVILKPFGTHRLFSGPNMGYHARQKPAFK